MKKILPTALVTLLFFLIGSVGMYLSVPRLFPEKVAAVDSLAADTLGAMLEADSLDMPRMLRDSLSVALSDSSLALPTDTAALVEALPGILAVLRDSVQTLSDSRVRLAAERDSARARVRALEQRLESAILPEANPAELAKTIAGMDEKEMQPILARISDSALMALYHTASARDKKALMAAMPADRAVRLVQQQLAAHERPLSTRDVPPDSTAM